MRNPSRTIDPAILLALPALLIAVSAARAHAFLERAAPAVGSTVPAAPAEITLRFTERIEPTFSTVQVIGPGGERVDAGDARVDAREPASLHVPLKTLTAGTYKVVWRVVSVDSHVTDGDFKFTVAP
jgi:methionine-rich copper-binding protein CopC